MTAATALRCPSCSHKPLRVFEHRLVCDACNGMLMPTDDFATAVREIDPSRGPLGFDDPQDAGKRCPRCACRMSSSPRKARRGTRFVKPPVPPALGLVKAAAA